MEYVSSGCEIEQTHATYSWNSPLEHLHVCEDCCNDEEDAHEDDVVGVDLLGGGRERTAVPPVSLRIIRALAAPVAAAAVRSSPLPPLDRPGNQNFARIIVETETVSKL